MHPELTKLVQLHELEHQAAALSAQIAGYAQRVSARESALAEATRALETNVQALGRESASRRRMETDAEDFRQKSARYRAQLDDVQSDSQMKALEHQIGFCKQEIDRIEEVELASLMETETLESQQTTLRETIANLQRALDGEKAEAEAGRAADEASRAILICERDAVRSDTDAALLAQYDRISATGKAAVARVEGQRCSACQMVVRPQRWNEIREGAVYFCESCGRFLYYDPAIDLTDAMHLPPMTKKPAGPAKMVQQAAATGSGDPARED